ncbi:MAG: MarR family winged helix-turn-helix transcriptional regulator [Verrucomicrobiota bacterium]
MGRYKPKMGLESEVQRAALFRAGLRRFLRKSEEVAAGCGLSPQRYDLLLFVQAAPGQRTTTTALTGMFQLGQPAVTQLVNRAEVAGLVSRTPDGLDRRRIWIELTPAGRDRLSSCLQELGEARDDLAAAISQAERGHRQSG